MPLVELFMCGLAGFFGRDIDASEAERILTRMGDTIRHRGPDDSGSWFKPGGDFGLGLVHRRLSIVDLSSAGHQPMQSQTNRFTIVFNGEIYNHLVLRQSLMYEKYAKSWRGHSDTETLLAGFEAWGIKETIEKCTGMFAFAVWDDLEKELVLGRDRLGEKPLYYGWQDDTFIFASELKAIAAHPSFKNKIDRNSLASYVRFRYVPAPHSIFQGIKKLNAGDILIFSENSKSYSISSYWSPRAVVESNVTNESSRSSIEIISELEKCLRKAISDQMIADVSLGAFLSGGIDSSLITSLMQTQSSVPVNTYSIGFDDKNYNEAEHAKSVAQHLGTTHTEFYVSSNEALNVIPLLPTIYDEPFADSSQIPTYLLTQMAKKHVTVALSGDGGDELFCGYNRYIYAEKYGKKFADIPRSIRKIFSNTIQTASPDTWKTIASFFPKSIFKGADYDLIGDQLHKVASVIHASSSLEVYRKLVSSWDEPDSLVLGATEYSSILDSSDLRPSLKNDIELMMAVDMMSYMSEDILVKVDRAAMSNSLETRVPFLDHNVVEHAWRIPLEFKLRNGQSKWCLRQILYKYVPPELIERPKKGFGVPLASWLRGPLKEWAEELIGEKRLRIEGFFNVKMIRRIWLEHLSEKYNHENKLWTILMFQAWLNENASR